MRTERRRDRTDHVLVARPGATAANADVPVGRNVVGVAYDHPAESWLGNWQAGPERVTVVSPGERARSTAAAAGSDNSFGSLPCGVETVADPADVAAVGARVNDRLVAWRGDGETTVFLDGLSGLLDSVDPETAFRFTHAVLARANSVDARVVASVDTDRHAPDVWRTLAELFSDVRT